MSEAKNPVPSNGNVTLTATLAPAIPYSGQKVTMTVTPSIPVPSGTTTNLQFKIDTPFQGISSYPSAEAELEQDISSALAGPWHCPGIIDANGSDPVGMEGILYKSDPKDNGNPRGVLSGSVGKGKPVTIDKIIFPSAVFFKAVASPSKPVAGGTQQLPIGLKIVDKNSPSTVISGKFSPLFYDGNNQPLSDVAFYSGDNEAASAIVNSVTPDGTNVAVDTLTSDNQKLNCWVVPADGNSCVLHLRMMIGSSLDASVGTVVLINETDSQYDGYLRAPLVKEAISGPINVEAGIDVLHIYIPKPKQDALLPGDKLMLLINGEASPNGSISIYQDTDYLTLFTIPSNDSRLISKTSDYPTVNTFQYVAWRETEFGPSAPKLSTPNYPVFYSIDPNLRYTPGPSHKGDPDYGAPEIPEAADLVILNAGVIAKGLHVTVSWSGNGSNWVPQDKDSITITFYLDGWDESGKKKPQSTPSLPYVLDQVKDINNKSGITLSVPPDWFGYYGQDFKDSGVEPKLYVQYSVLHTGADSSTAIYSQVFSISFDTINAGTGTG